MQGSDTSSTPRFKAAAQGVEETLRSVIEPLAARERGAGSPGEKQAAEMLVKRFERVGAPAHIDEEEFLDGYARLMLPLGAAGLVAGLLATRGRRVLPAVLAAASTAAMVDDVENGWRLWRRAVGRRRTTWNVVAECGDLTADRTLVVMAHYDAAPTGVAFDQGFQRWLAKRFPDLVQRTDTALPIWWPVVAGPVLTMVAALTGRRGLARAASALSALSVGLGADIARGRIVPGANDNLSGVGALVALAERLRDDSVARVRVMLVSCGAEEVLQGGVYGFVERHLKPLDPTRTWVLNLDSVGSPELLMVEGEGPFWMHEYCDPSFRDRVASVTEHATGAPLRRGTQARASTDSIIPSRAGYPTATLVSWEPDTKLISNYHLPTDVPENLCWETIERTVVVAEALARELGEEAGTRNL
jgi:hypothetical protein